MKNIFLLFLAILALNSCDPKGIGGVSEPCDTIVKIRVDTIFKPDTVLVEKIKYINDTIYVRDTIYKTIVDTLYIDKPVFIYDTIFKTDTIYKSIIERDTINIIKVDTLRITDTIIRTEFIQKWDTVFLTQIDTILIDKIVRDTILINKVDTVEVVKPLPKYTKDTLVWGLARIKINPIKQISFTELGTFNSYNLKTLDTTIYECGVSYPIMKADSLQFNIRKFYEGNYLVKAEEIEKSIDTTFQIVEFAIRTQDANGTYTQTYCNGTWDWSSRRANSIDELGDFIPVDYQHGTAIDYAADGKVYPILYRNSHSFDTKYFEIKATSRETGKSVTTGIIENPFM